MYANILLGTQKKRVLRFLIFGALISFDWYLIYVSTDI